MWVTTKVCIYTQTVANPSCSTKGMCTLQSALSDSSWAPTQTPGESEGVVPASKEGNLPPKGGNPLKAEKNGARASAPASTGAPSIFKEVLNGSSKKKQKCLVKP